MTEQSTWPECTERHPRSGNVCVRGAHDPEQMHYAMGEKRMQSWHPNTTAAPAPSDLPHGRDAAIEELTEAIRLTVEYVGTETLPPVEGWSWYDALVKYAPDKAAALAHPGKTRWPAPVSEAVADRR